MTIAQIQASIEYVTNAAGEKINVLVPVGIWDKLIKSLQSIANDLDRVDEEEPKAQILDDCANRFDRQQVKPFPSRSYGMI